MLDTIGCSAVSLRHDDAQILQLRAAEALRAASFFDTVPEQTRYRRFHRVMSATMVLAHYSALDWNTAIVLAWIERDEILGIAEVHPYPVCQHRETEIALSLKPMPIEVRRKKLPQPCLTELHQPSAGVELGHDDSYSYGGHFGLALMTGALSRAAATGARCSRMLLCPPDPVQLGFGRRLGGVFDAPQDTLVFTH